MFSPTFHDWPRLNRLMLFALLAVFITALLVLYLYVMPKWRQHQAYQKAIQEKESRLAATPWPQETDLLGRHYKLIREKLDGVPGTDQLGLVKLSEDIIQQATNTFSERILKQFDSTKHFINGVSRIDYKDAYDRFAQELTEQQLTLESTRFGLNEDGQEPVWQMILKLWTAQMLYQLARENHLTVLADEEGVAAISALPPIAYAVAENDPPPPYLLEFPIRLRLAGHLDDFLRFAQQLSAPVRFLPLKQLEISTTPPNPPVAGQTNRVDTATFNIVCSSFFQPTPPTSDVLENE